jgi:RimJ/RimL family protein N-acetyltransferase
VIDLLTRIRKAEVVDLQLLMKLEREFWRDIREIVLIENRKMKPYLRPSPGRDRMIAKWMRNWIRSRNARVFIVEIRSRPVGFSVAFIQNTPGLFLPKRHGYVGYVFVKHRYRGQRLGALMMKETLLWFEKRKIEHVCLTVLADNKPAKAIWDKMGFCDFNVVKWKV